jgi:hypothetical protein
LIALQKFALGTMADADKREEGEIAGENISTQPWWPPGRGMLSAPDGARDGFGVARPNRGFCLVARMDKLWRWGPIPRPLRDRRRR